MSDVSVLSHEYKRASELSQTINRALIKLKKARLGLPGSEGIPPEELDASQRSLAEIVTALTGLLELAKVQRVPEAAGTRVPSALVARLRVERQGDLAYYLDDLKRVAAHLHEGPSKLSDTDLALLDQLATAADAETSKVFRQLMRK